MIYGPAFYKLLQIPESVTDLTVYHLLDLKPRAVTPERLSESLRQRKRMLRRNIPGPQFIPIVSMIERELDRCAGILSDAAKRKEYDSQLVREARRRKQRTEQAQRAKLVAACRQAVRAMLKPDGSLDDDRRGQLVARLGELGLPDNQTEYVLQGIPRPAAGEEISDEEKHQAMQEANRFFVAAIDLEINGGVLDAQNEQKLLAMAAKFGIPAAAARTTIAQRLGARPDRPEGDQPDPAAEMFAKQVLAMHPDGRASAAERSKLLALAEVQGLAGETARATIATVLGPPDVGPPVPPPAEPPAAPAEPARAPRRSLLRFVPAAVVALLAVGAVSLAVWKLRSMGLGLDDPAPTAQRPDTQGGDGSAGRVTVPTPPATKPAPPARSALLTKALNMSGDPDQVKHLFSLVSPGEAAQAVREALALTGEAGTLEEKHQAEGLLDLLASCPPATVEVQDVYIRTLIQCQQEWYRPSASPPSFSARDNASRLSRLLLLRSSPPTLLTSRPRGLKFVIQCQREWQRSLARHPNDPLNDPDRLFLALMNGGNLTYFAQRADEPRMTALMDRLVAGASDRAQSGSSGALEQLLRAASWPGPGAQVIVKPARLALCRVIRQTADPGVANTARHHLRRVLNLVDSDPLVLASLSRSSQRQQVARELESAVISGRKWVPSVRPLPPTNPRIYPQATTALAPQVCAKYSSSGRTQDLLTDVALTLLACSDRAEEFTTGAVPPGSEVATAIRQTSTSRRAMIMTRAISLWTSGPPGATTPANPSVKPTAGELKMLARNLRSSLRYRRNAAVDRLGEINTRESAKVLLDHLAVTAKARSIDGLIVNRILAALLEMKDPSIPQRLAGMIATAQVSYVAHRIVQTLIRGVGLYSTVLELPAISTQQERQRCGITWVNYVSRYKRWSVKGPIGTGYPPVPPQPRTYGPVPVRPGGSARRSVLTSRTPSSPKRPTWQPDSITEKLLVLLGYCGRLTGKHLAGYKWNVTAAPARFPPVIRRRSGATPQATGPIAGKELAESFVLANTELARLIRDHDSARGDKKIGMKVSMLTLKAKARLAACETPLQEAAVQLQLTGDLLELLVGQVDPQGGTRQAIRDARSQRDKALASPANVLVEMREISRHNLVLWDLLLGR